MLEDPKIQRLKELSKILSPTEDDILELEQLKTDLGFTDFDIRKDQYEPIAPIKRHRMDHEKTRAREDELKALTTKRKELEVILNTRKEKARIERIKHQLDGEIYCDDCHKWVNPSHFD